MKIIVMTGVSSGIGRMAAQQLTERGHRVIGGVLDPVDSTTFEVLPLDLGDLHAVRAFATSFETLQFDALVLNAGTQGYDLKALTAQGLERTFGVNHLAHYLLARLLLPRIKECGTIVFTTSATHDPAEKTRMPPPLHANAEWLAYPERNPKLDRRPMTAGLRAYSSSKLCNVMTARTLAAQPEVLARGLRVFAYDPGLTPGTGLVQSGPFAVRRLFWPLMALIEPFSSRINSIVDAGRGLADLSDGAASSFTEVYCSLRNGNLTWLPPSALARDDLACTRLWRESAAIAGVPL